ncbi:MAG: RnfABCDGE type electron transport complex subunit G [Clostridiales bacterium]|uniref:Ion-translocating oxidoreductase complex subunit G n=1 Tax=Candidatus Pullilachnospira stercoravium TaxID=2840913 RepID=A0A9D1NT79_9FIRM|nr:RnfABCDGE type electron transport complex subunit G [Clostridiales bacterium]HIV11883.1 RnfABCDGE type electron transport complex subunit G [Candidatus Pullilachnospira stercoravium]
MSSKIIRDALALTAITLVSGLALGAVYGITKEPIARQEELAKQEAYQEVFPEAEQFQTVTLDEELSGQIRSGLDEAGYTQDSIQEVTEALDDEGQRLGYAITVLTTAGYGGEIQFSMGVSLDGTVNGISFLSISETAGLGMKADTEEFRGQFAQKQVEAFTYTKNGASEEDEIDAISGATITTSAVTDAVNAGLCAFRILES